MATDKLKGIMIEWDKLGKIRLIRCVRSISTADVFQDPFVFDDNLELAAEDLNPGLSQAITDLANLVKAQFKETRPLKITNERPTD